MIYLCLYTADDVQIAACEDDRNVACYEARGFVRCTLAAFRQAWRKRDVKRLAELRGELPEPPPQAVEVGGVKRPIVYASLPQFRP